jgi:DNA-binding SARP family transcriptional activator/tetratricopeptide (TPR) repeat protein
MTRPSVQARLLGAFEVTIDGRTLPRAAFERPSGIRLLKLLLAWPGHSVRREEAAELLWPEADPERSAANLRKAVHFARRAVERGSGRQGEVVLSGDGDRLRIPATLDLDVDLDRLLEALEIASRQPDAVAAPRRIAALRTMAGLPGLELLPDDPYEEWLVPIRERLRQRLLSGLIDGARLARVIPERELAFALVERALALEPADEAAHRVAIELHLDADQLHAARRQLEACRRAVAEVFGVEPSPGLQQLIEDASARRARASAISVAEPAIVGRRHELELAETAFDRATGGWSSAVLLRGPAGIGKSRLLRELGRLATASGWQLLEARGMEATPETALAQLGQALGEAFGETTDLPEPVRSAVLTAAPRRTARPELTFASDDALGEGLISAVEMLLQHSAVLLAIDDLQWLDRASRNLVVRALRRLPRTRFLVAATLREPVVEASVGETVQALLEGLAVDVPLAPLGEREIRVILERDAPQASLPDALGAHLAELSTGAPLFALELFRTARAREVVEVRAGRWQLRPGADLERVPSTVSRLVDERVSGLDSHAREVLATAAELGRDIRFDELVAATGAEGDEVLDTLDAAIAAGLVTEAGGGYRFAHPLFRASLRQSLPPRLRGPIHLRVARALGGGIDPADRAAIQGAASGGVDIVAVAGHATVAAEMGQPAASTLAVGFGLAAGEHLSRLFDDRAAVEMLRQTIPLWHGLPEEDRRRFPASAAQIELGQSLRRLGDDRAAAAALSSAIVTARDDPELARAYSAAAWLPYEHGRFEEADRLLVEGLERVTDELAVATLQSSRGWVLARMGRSDLAEPLLRASIATLERRPASAALMRALDRLASGLPSVPPREASQLLERALVLSREIGEEREQTTLRMHLAGRLMEAGLIEEARTEVRRAIEKARVTGERYLESVSEWIAAEVEQAAGRPEEAIEHRRRELAIFDEIGGNSLHEAMAHAHLSHLATLSGDPELATAEAAAARLVARHAGDGSLARRVDRRLAEGWPLATGGPAPPGSDDAGPGNSVGTVADDPVSSA